MIFDREKLDFVLRNTWRRALTYAWPEKQVKVEWSLVPRSQPIGVNAISDPAEDPEVVHIKTSSQLEVWVYFCGKNHHMRYVVSTPMIERGRLGKRDIEDHVREIFRDRVVEQVVDEALSE